MASPVIEAYTLRGMKDSSSRLKPYPLNLEPPTRHLRYRELAFFRKPPALPHARRPVPHINMSSDGILSYPRTGTLLHVRLMGSRKGF